MLNLFRSGSNLYKQAWRLKQSTRLPMAGTRITRSASGVIPDGYEQFHLKEEDNVQPLDNVEPLSPERRAQLAAKYNLRPEDYVPMNDPSFNVGDYPTLPMESTLARDPHYDWDCKVYRRNYGEPILWDLEAYGPIHLDTTPMIYDRRQMWSLWAGYAVVFVVLYTLGAMFPSFMPHAPKQYPEYYPGDEKKGNGYYHFFEDGGHDLNPQYRSGHDVTNYTFVAHPWNPEAH